MTVTNTPERQRRIADLWARRPNMTHDEIVAEVDAALDAEADDRAEGEARANDLAASFVAMALTCAACGASRLPGASTPLCVPCAAVDRALEAETAAADTIDGTTRRALVEAYRQKAG